MPERNRRKNIETEHKVTPIAKGIVVKAGYLVLLEKANEDGTTYYTLPGGHVHLGESSRDGLIRELREELGIEVSPSQAQHVQHFDDSERQRSVSVFLVEQYDGTPFNAEPDKHQSMGLFPFEELPENTSSYVRRIIQNYKEKIRYDSI